MRAVSGWGRCSRPRSRCIQRVRESLEPREQPQGAEYGDQATAQTLSLSAEQEAVGGGIERLEAEKWGVLQRSFWPLESIRAKSGNKEPAKRLTQAPSNRWRWPWWPGGWEEQRARRLC